MENCAKSGRSSNEIDLALTDEDNDIDMCPEPMSRISEHKRAEIRNICESGFGKEFMKDHAESEFANFSTLLDMLQRNQFASVAEVKREAVCFLDAQLWRFQDSSSQTKSGTYQRSEMIVMAENLKQRFEELVVDEASVHCQSTEFMIVERLCEIFPHLDHIELHLKVNHYLGQRMTKRPKGSEKGIDVALAVNEISEEIFEAESDFVRFPKIGQQGELSHFS